MRFLKSSWTLAPLLAFAVMFVAFVPSASAANPETPELRVESITASNATFYGVLNPNAPGVAGTYEFFYKASKTGACEGESHAPVSPGVSFGAQHEELPAEPVSGLKPNTEYAVCLLTETSPTEKTLSVPLTFTSAPEAPETKAATLVTAKTATFNGVLNPKAEATAGYYFSYNANGTCEGFTTPQPPVAEAKVKALSVSTPVTGLEPNQKYTVCLVAFNAAGAQSTVGNAVPVETKPAPPEVVSETTSGVTPYEATLEAQVNPNNQSTTYVFEYAEKENGGKLEGTITTLKGAGAPLSGFGNETASVATGHHLQPGTIYHYRVVAENAKGEKEAGEIEEFKTPAATAPVIESEGTAGLTPFEVTLVARVNTDYQETTCKFEYAANEAEIGTHGATTVACPYAPGSGGPGAEASVKVAGLSAKTPYYFRFVATNASGETKGTVVEPIKKFETLTTEPPIVASEGTGVPPFELPSITSNGAALSATVNPNYQATTYDFEYSTSQAEVEAGKGITVPGGEIPADTAASFAAQQAGPSYLDRVLAPETPYFYRVVASNKAGTTSGPVQEFTTLIAPLAGPASVQDVTRTTATFSGGSVNALGVQTSYRYAFTAQSDYEKALAQSLENPYVYGRGTPETSIGSESTVEPTGPAAVSALTPGTTYDYALVATNTLGSVTIGPDQTFTTAPGILPALTGVSVSNVTQSAATISATLEPKGEPTRWELLLGTAPGELIYRASGRTSSSEAEPLVVNAGSLSAGTTYYYKFVAVNPDGTVETPEASFTTVAAPVAAPEITPPLLALPDIAFPKEEALTPTTTPKKTAKCPKGKKRNGHGKCIKVKTKAKKHKAKKSNNDRRASR
jgi:hypothetical protein